MSISGDIVEERYEKTIQDFLKKLEDEISWIKKDDLIEKYKSHFNIKVLEDYIGEIEVQEDNFNPSTYISNYRPLYPFEDKYDNEFVEVAFNELSNEIYKTSCGYYWARTPKEIALINRFEKIYNIVLVCGAIGPFGKSKIISTCKDGYKVIVLGKLKQ